ncbi:unnamed protein product [Fraxinus pennsylvanica]|uniref:Uncharacterized protein n=1 Tax=Fraxinus pennsylvanica TaxID=56036 RepID=A0AAD1YRJ4_9LAMI|nr:unnamed protein product [Fraxinus pennsylvanica]
MEEEQTELLETQISGEEQEAETEELAQNSLAEDGGERIMENGEQSDMQQIQETERNGTQSDTQPELSASGRELGDEASTSEEQAIEHLMLTRSKAGIFRPKIFADIATMKTSGGAGLHFPHAGDGHRTPSLHFPHASDGHRLCFIQLVADLAGKFGRTTSFGVAGVIVHRLWIPLISP